MTENLVPLYGCAALTVTMLGVFARQNRKSGWKRERATPAQAWHNFYSKLGIVISADSPNSPPEWTPVTAEEAIDFSAQMLKLRSALGSGTKVTAGARSEDLALVHQ